MRQRGEYKAILVRICIYCLIYLDDLDGYYFIKMANKIDLMPA